MELKDKKYIDLDKKYSSEYLQKQYKGKGEPFALHDKNYYVRMITDDNNAYKELLAVELLKRLGLSHVNYQLAKLFDKPCLLSESFCHNNFRTISGYEILEDYNKSRAYDIDCANNLDMIMDALSKRFHLTKADDTYKKLQDQFNKMFCFDLLFSNSNRKSDNWYILTHLVSNNGQLYNDINLGPIFDNECIFEDEYRFAMGIDYDGMRMGNMRIESLIKQAESKEELKEILKDFMSEIDEKVFTECVANVGYNIGGIPMEVMAELINKYHHQRELLEKIYTKSR